MRNMSQIWQQKIFWQRHTTPMSHHNVAHTSQPMSLPSIKFLHLTVLEIQPKQDLKVKDTTARSKLNYGDTMLLHTYTVPKTNVTTYFLQLTVWGILWSAQKRLFHYQPCQMPWMKTIPPQSSKTGVQILQ